MGLIMSIRSVMTYIGSGKPMNPAKNLAVNREPSRKGVIASGVRSTGEFNDLIKSKNNVDQKTLGRGAVKLQKSLGISINVTI